MQAASDVNSLRQALWVSGVVSAALVVYAVILINTLMKIWHHEFKDKNTKILWFLFVLVLSPIGMPVYLIINRKQKTGKSDAAEDNTAKDRHIKQPGDSRSRRTPLSDEDRARELARLLEMKKSGILSKDEYEKAKKRLL